MSGYDGRIRSLAKIERDRQTVEKQRNWDPREVLKRSVHFADDPTETRKHARAGCAFCQFVVDQMRKS